jgi:hypothetical protein
MRTLVLLIVIAGPTLSQDVNRTGPYYNGRFWMTLGSQAKEVYTIAVLEGINAVSSNTPLGCSCAYDAVKQTMNRLYAERGDALITEAVEELDGFFKEPANRKIPIVGAMRYLGLQRNGGSKQELDTLLSSMRKDSQ